MKLTEYENIESLNPEDILITDGVRGTKKVTMSNFLKGMIELGTPEQRRKIFGGRNLGGAVTAEQLAAIKNGSFKGLLLGDYWTIGNVRWRIVDFDYWYNCGDQNFTKHHLVIVPDSCLYSAQMHQTESGGYESGSEANTTEGGYTGSDMYNTGLTLAKTKIAEAFGDAVLTHREYLTNAVSSGFPSGGAWFDSSVELMNEPMVYGSYIYTPGGNGSIVINRYTISKQQLALFALCPRFVNILATYWLRDVVSSAGFAVVDVHGGAYYHAASNSLGVRPVFPIG